MATINIKYNPALSVFFNSDGKLVIGDVNGDYGDGNENGWGGFNPPKNSVTVATFSLINHTTGDTYLLTGGNYFFDLLSDGFYDTTNQLLIEADAYTDLDNFLTLQITPNNSSQFKQGVYYLKFDMSGTYTFGGDTVNWISINETFYSIANVVNLNSNCIENILRNVSFAKKCKMNKKFSYLNMYFNMLYEYEEYITLTGGLISDFIKRVVKINDILDEIKGLCNGKNNCKC
jgi:hypothetical protein